MSSPAAERPRTSTRTARTARTARNARNARLAAGLCIVAMVLAAQPAAASPREAQERFEEGRALVKAGQPADAIPKFLASFAAEPTLAALLNLADCYERIGKLASARTRFKQAQALAKDKDPLRADEARKRVELLDSRVSTITLLPPARGVSARVWIDGVEVPAAEWGTPVPYDAGTHEIVTVDAGGKRRSAAVEVAQGAARVTFPIAVEAEPAAPAPAPVVAPPRDGPEPPPSSSGSLKTVGLVLGATGIVAIGVGAVTGGLALGASSDLKSTCGDYPRCPVARRDEATSLDDRAHTMGTISTITLIGGAVLVAAGAIMYFTSAPSSRQGNLRVPTMAGVAW